MSDQPNNLATALAAAQGEMPAAKKSRTVTVKHKNDPGQHSYSYAEMPAVVEAIRGPLSKYRLAWTQRLSQSAVEVTVTTILMYGPTGETLDGGPLTARAASLNPQDIGSVITYLRRYSLMALLGVPTEDDDGAGGEDPPPKAEPKTEAGKGGSKAGKGKDKGKAEPKGKAESDPPPAISLAELLAWLEKNDCSPKMLTDWLKLKGYPPPGEWDDEHRVRMGRWLKNNLASVFDQLTAAEAERALGEGKGDEPGSRG